MASVSRSTMRIHAQRKPLGKCRRLLAAPHLVCDGKPVALGAKRTKHANLDMVDGINRFNLAGLEQALALALPKSSRSEYRDSSRTGSFLRILPAGSPRQCMARRAKSRYDGSRIPAAIHGHPGRKIAISARSRPNAAPPSRPPLHQPASGLYRVAPLPRVPKPSRCYADTPRAPAAMRYRACTQSTPRQV